MAKSRGADAPQTDEQEISTEKFLNTGLDVTLKSGIVAVKELSFSNLISILSKAASVLSKASSEDQADENFLTNLMGNPEAQVLLNEIFAASTGKKATEFDNLPAADGLRLIAAINKVNDFVEIFSVFQEMGLQKILSNFTEQKNPNG